ncbi:hypothetical protein GCM10022252_40190 [Streptosporangium oxazolinicum]|uniref:Uncharacterized protein n=1 Tax=Streptosporangium oxazolinicum TaxID=909287 RepID=A0ABP8B0K9_9ACTN
MGALAAAMNVVRVSARSTEAAPVPRRARRAGDAGETADTEDAGDTEDVEGMGTPGL